MKDEGWLIEEGEEVTGYQRLEVWRMARDLSIKIHRMSMNDLPRFELYETGSQIRRSAKSVRANIVEGFGKRRYKLEFLRHLTYALGSAQETLDHIDTLHETGSLTSSELHTELTVHTRLLIAKLTTFMRGVELHHRS